MIKDQVITKNNKSLRARTRLQPKWHQKRNRLTKIITYI